MGSEMRFRLWQTGEFDTRELVLFSEHFSCVKKGEHMEITVGLIKGRHMMPVEEYIFDKAIDKVHDYKGIRNHIEDFLVNRVGIGRTYGAGINQDDYTDVQLFCGKANLVVYVTGLTPVTVELVASCMRNGIHLTLMNYDTASGNYIPQSVL